MYVVVFLLLGKMLMKSMYFQLGKMLIKKMLFDKKILDYFSSIVVYL